MAGLEALDYWTHLCDCDRRKTNVRLFVSNEYLSFRFGCIIEPTGFIMNKHIDRALPMPDTADGDASSRRQVLDRAGSVHHGADQ